jgi:glutamate--cysteine ligase catalytic subunit
MVVAFDDEKKAAYLSLRQTEILQKLQSVTLDPALEKIKPAGWYVHFSPRTWISS